jgi:hypothetical protein
MTEGSHKTEQHNELVVEIIGALNLRFKNLNLYYEAGWTDSFLPSPLHARTSDLDRSGRMRDAARLDIRRRQLGTCGKRI